MDKLQELKQQYDDKLKAAKALQAKVKEACEKEERDPTDEDWKEFDALTEEIDGIKAQVETIEANQRRDASLTAAEEWQKDGPGRITRPFKPTNEPHKSVPAQVRRHAGRLTAFQGDGAEERAFGFGSWLAATQLDARHPVQPKAAKWCRDNGLDIYATLSSSSNSAGGALIPDVFVPDLIRLIEERGVFRQFANVVPMVSDTAIWPRLTSTQTAYFTAEAANPTESDPAFDNVELVAKKVAVMTVVPSELMEDSMIDLGDIVARESAHAIAALEDTVGFVGAGTAAHGGIQGVATKINDGNHDGSITTAASGNTAFSTLDLADFENCMGSLPMFPGQMPRWYISKVGFYASMQRLMDAAGGNTIGDIANGTPLQFLGYPVTLVQVMNTTTGADVSALKALFGDLRQAAMFGNRRLFAIGSDGGGKYFQAGTIAIKATTRFDVNVHDVGDGTNAGPIVGLETAAS